MKTGVKIKQYLEGAGISLRWLSGVSLISRGRLERVLGGSERLTLEEYEAICRVLRLPRDAFLEPERPGLRGEGCGENVSDR